jgi:hypothetical protein
VDLAAVIVVLAMTDAGTAGQMALLCGQMESRRLQSRQCAASTAAHPGEVQTDHPTQVAQAQGAQVQDAQELGNG